MSTYRSRAAAESSAEGGARGIGVGWTVFSYLIGGMVAYGAIGWLVGRAVHAAWPFPVGMLTGLGISLGYIIFRYGRQDAAEEGRGNR